MILTRLRGSVLPDLGVSLHGASDRPRPLNRRQASSLLVTCSSDDVHTLRDSRRWPARLLFSNTAQTFTRSRLGATGMSASGKVGEQLNIWMT